MADRLNQCLVVETERTECGCNRTMRLLEERLGKIKGSDLDPAIGSSDGCGSEREVFDSVGNAPAVGVFFFTLVGEPSACQVRNHAGVHTRAKEGPGDRKGTYLGHSDKK